MISETSDAHLKEQRDQSASLDFIALDEANVRIQLALLWSKRWLILTVSVACCAFTTVAAFLVPPKYQASVVLEPVTGWASGGGGGLSSVAAHLGGLAELAGVSSFGNERKAANIEVLQSRALTEAYIEQNKLLPILFRKYWNFRKDQWENVSKSEMPTLWKANQLFENGIRNVTTSPTTGLVTLTITWRNPNLAAIWANGLVQMANEKLRNSAIREAEQNISYLKQQAVTTNIVAMKEVIYSLMKEELDREMVARGRKEYAFKILDPAVPSEKPSSPVKTLWILAGLIGGFFSSVMVIFVRASWATVPR